MKKIQNKRYLLVMKSTIKGWETINIDDFYTLEEAKIVANRKNECYFQTTIIDLEDKNIKWQGCDNMWKDEDGKVYTEEDLFNEALEECHSEDSAYEYIDTLIMDMNLEEI